MDSNNIIGDTACPACQEMGRDKTGNHLMLFEDGGAYCNRTQHHESGAPYSEPKGSRDADGVLISEEEGGKTHDIMVNQTNSDRFCDIGQSFRSIKPETFKRFGVKCGHSETNGELDFLCFPRGSNNRWKLKHIGSNANKKYSVIGGGTNPMPLGYNLVAERKANTNTLFITEGELDAMSLYQAIKDSNVGTKWETLEPAVISLPDGSSSVSNSLANNKAVKTLIEEYITNVNKKVVLFFDADDEGDKAVKSFFNIFGHGKSVAAVSRDKLNSMGYKDANELLQDDKGNVIKSLILSAQPYTPASIVSVEEISERAMERPKIGLSLPFQQLTHILYGIQPATIYGLAGGVGLGKSTVGEEIIAHLAAVHNEKVGCFMLEEPPDRTLKKLAGKIMKKPFHIPDVEYTEDELTEGINKLKDKVFFLDHQGVKEWKEVKEYIQWMAEVENIKYIFLDPLTGLVAHLSSSEANDELNKMMSDLSTIVNRSGITVFYFAHLNPPNTGKAHERGGRVLESQLTGSRAMVKWSQYILGIERNKDPDLTIEEQNKLTITLLKDRYYGNSGKFDVFYDPDTGSIRENLGGGGDF